MKPSLSTLLAAASIICGATYMYPANDTINGNTAAAEADAFLASLPAGLQASQTQAIHAAMAGDTEPLQRVRNARNSQAELPAGVTRTDINGHLTMFRSDRYDNDSIPLLVYFHGGGWVIGSINSCSRYCAAMADNGVAVLAVDYRLAPEHPFPAGLNDCRAAAELALESLAEWKCNGIFLGGDSSGGNLAIATALSFPANTFSGLCVFYPVTKAYADDSESWKQYGYGLGLDSELMQAFNRAYTSDTHNPLVSPAQASDSALANLPPTLLVAAERDILRCQGREFACRVAALGVEVRYVLIPGSVHLFITVPGQPASFSQSVAESTEFITGRTAMPARAF